MPASLQPVPAPAGLVLLRDVIAAQWRPPAGAKSAVLPPIRVEQSFRAELEACLHDGESLSGFVERALRASLRRRGERAAFAARAAAALAHARRTGAYRESDQVVEDLRRMAARRAAAAAAADDGVDSTGGA